MLGANHDDAVNMLEKYSESAGKCDNNERKWRKKDRKMKETGKTLGLIEGNLEVKLPTIWTDEKQSRAEAERRERLEERRSEKRKSQKKEDADARKGRKVAKHCVFPMICGVEK